ncbi:MAG: membrane dipeptidase [Oscillospiraceae bacterium]|nr:membrane dipeptidase [Oscillospiraceae bacterium]
MNFFDLHADTLFELDKQGLILDNKTLAVNLKNMRGFEKIIRCYAVFTPDEIKGENAERHYDRLLNVFNNQINKYREVTKIENKDDLENIGIGAILTVENLSILNGKLENIEKLKENGVKLCSLTWNGENELGFGSAQNKKLKLFGKQAVAELEKNNIIIDVSHLSDKGFEDVLKLSKRPFIASHSNSRKICNNARNLKDEHIKEIIKRNGLIGINFYKFFLNKKGNAELYDVLKHIEHILSLGGENVLSIGTDFDGADVIRELSDDSKVKNLYTLLLENGYNKQIADKIFYKNAYNFFSNNI